MAAALPMASLRAWRVYFGLPLTGRRLPAGGFDELMRLGYADAVLHLFGPILSQAIEEAPAALAAVRAELGIPEEPIGVAGGSLGGTVAAGVIADCVLPVAAAVLIKPAVRITGAVAAIEQRYDIRYEWTDAEAWRRELIPLCREPSLPNIWFAEHLGNPTHRHRTRSPGVTGSCGWITDE